MNIGIMRAVDYFLGSLLCFLLSVIHGLITIGQTKGQPLQQASKVLFIKFLGMGSIALATPAIRRAKKLYPEAEFFFLTFRAHRGLFEITQDFKTENILLIRDDSFIHFSLDSLRAIWFLRQLGITVSVDFEFFSRYSSLMSFLIGARHKVGFYNHHTEGLYRGDFLTHKVFYNCYQHTSLAFLDLIECLKVGNSFPQNKLVYHELPHIEPIIFLDSERRQILEKFGLEQHRPLIVINANCTPLIPLRRWPPQFFMILIKRLLETTPAQIVLVGAPAERQYVEELLNSLRDSRIHNLAGKTSLRELCLILDVSRYFITNDSGPAHLASFTQTKVISLFGPETPVLYAPLGQNNVSLYLGLGCSPCVTIYNGKHTLCKDNQCMKRISPEMILAQIKI